MLVMQPSATGVQSLYLYSNSLSGTLPASWGNMQLLQSLYLYSNSLSGTLPSSWSALRCQINVTNNCLAGSIPTTFSAATSRIQWIDVCNTRVWPRNFSMNIMAVCMPNTLRRCMTSDSFTLSAVIASLSMSNESSISLTTSLSLVHARVRVRVYQLQRTTFIVCYNVLAYAFEANFFFFLCRTSTLQDNWRKRGAELSSLRRTRWWHERKCNTPKDGDNRRSRDGHVSHFPPNFGLFFFFCIFFFLFPCFFFRISYHF
ncbi:GP46-like surface antigen, putative [Bodo saltans]|uniref:GP46-like surface antigen, putative n=1 Tax=Bodo saltans TaxID=75058 RepID=A0A0S4JWD6_BODSA|nr:GP46-like surface antigen, putative [Bodo saltans]|eukprot:CUG93729.1 GP46-like surface antigen, putative [Bodo saltans]